MTWRDLQEVLIVDELERGELCPNCKRAFERAESLERCKVCGEMFRYKHPEAANRRSLDEALRETYGHRA